MARPYPDAHRFKFGDTREICDWITGLAMEGKKTGTCWPYREAQNGEPMVKVGDISVYTDWDGNDLFAIEYTKIEIHRFDEIPEDFALSEGEGDYENWRKGHVDWLERCGGWSPDMEMVCENFRVIERF